MNPALRAHVAELAAGHGQEREDVEGGLAARDLVQRGEDAYLRAEKAEAPRSGGFAWLLKVFRACCVFGWS